MATSSMRPADSHPRFLKLLTRFHKKINPQKSSMDFDVQNPEKIINNRATTHGHKFPTNSRVSHSSLRKSKKNFTKPMPPLDPLTSDLQNPGKNNPKSPATRCNAPPSEAMIFQTTCGVILQIRANVLIISQN